MRDERLLNDMISRLTRALGERLVSVVLYGPEVRGDTVSVVGHLNLLLLTHDLQPDTLKALGPPVRWWLDKQQPWPRLFTRALVQDSLDVFPVEFLDLLRHRKVLHGEDPLADIALDDSNLRLQCERDLREKIMRLREGYVECGGATGPMRRLLAACHISFAPLWRSCLHMLGAEVPDRDAEVATRLCHCLGFKDTAFEEVALLAAGARIKDPNALFARYLHQLGETVARIDQLAFEPKEDSP